MSVQLPQQKNEKKNQPPISFLIAAVLINAFFLGIEKFKEFFFDNDIALTYLFIVFRDRDI